MKVHVQVLCNRGVVVHYNLLFEDGLRLTTDNLTWVNATERKAIATKFLALLETLRTAGYTIEGGVL